MKSFTLASVIILICSVGLFAQSGMRILGGGAVTVNGNTVITTSPFACGTPLIDVRNGKAYNTVQIGTQCWFAQNLNIGTRIDGITDQTNNTLAEKYCIDNLESNCDIYGGLYQWNESMQYSTVEGAQGLCPGGWHLPTDAEWSALTTYLGGEDIAGGKMKEAGTSHWTSPNSGATNSSGFTALPGGSRTNFGNFNFVHGNAAIWSSTQRDVTFTWYRDLYYDYEGVYHYDAGKTTGLSIRCLKD